MFRDIANVDK